MPPRIHRPQLFTLPRHRRPYASSTRQRPPQPPPRKPSTASSSSSYNYTHLPLTLLTTLSLLLFTRDNLFSIDIVNGASMSPTLSPHAHARGERDVVLISRLSSFSSGVSRGDVITFRKPHAPEELSIKRVLGVAGDVVFPKRGVGSWEDDPVTRGRRVFSYTDGLPPLLPSSSDDELGGRVEEGGWEGVKVPTGHVWVEGDNWRRSYDSRDFGPVSLALVDGRAVGVWRGWGRGFVGVGDKRTGRGDRAGESRVVEGRAGDGRLPEAFLE
ncbi:LexA/Signal peptidase [Aaosphaeria arxii CBS 175.79]|uniref:Mitochondrial inner membrane protease subunit n=1 Tax=Aaosphaeria arxii CBS 175.79 TaxID=1450172 RepID=A0A6A5XM10_9PLEO|nr:LexA/Signal peptidase [Aaosphaeria arxii CBS 175.79]KAF2014182.1 LexA/Signal peptidase [Aaosphaeria arxii CBS 175.79]